MITTQSDYLDKIETLKAWSRSYYVHDVSIATDEEYDLLARECLTYEQTYPDLADTDSPNIRVNGEAVDKFEKAYHLTKMWSQQDIFNMEELKTWISNKQHIKEFIIEPKYDGLSLNLIYQDGKLTKAITRGDGKIGENVINNVKVIHSIPFNIKSKGTIEVRGEIVMANKDFNALNEARESKGEKLFANPRNAAAGSLRQLDPHIVKTRKLKFYPWSVVDKDITKLSDLDNYLAKHNFIYKPLFKSVVIKNDEKFIDNVYSFYKSILASRSSLDVNIDGLVIKANETSTHAITGYTDRYPKWSCALKFPAIEKVTKILSVDFQVGRTGVITPVANVTPIPLDGSLVSRVILHNFDYIRDKGIKLNSNIVMIKSGDIIPKIIEVRESPNTTDIVMPVACPCCESLLEFKGSLLKCNNKLCKDKIKLNIVNYVSRDNMNIDGLGDSIIDLLVTKGKLRSITDLYKLTYDDLITLDSFQDKKVNNILEAIKYSINLPLEKLISGLGIELIGKGASKLLVDKFGFDILTIDKETLLKVDGIGEAMCNNFLNYRTEYIDMIEELIAITKPYLKEVSVDNKLDGKIYVITGKLYANDVEHKREDVKELILTKGGKVSDSVSSKTDVVIAGENAGTKLVKATELNIPVITLEEFLKSIES